MKIRLLLPVVAFSIFSLAVRARTTECSKNEDQGNTFLKTFIATHNGPSALPATVDSAARVLGTCSNTADHAENMMKHFEGFGVDLTAMRNNPYELYDDDRFTVTPFVVNPAANYKIILTTFYEYSQVVNIPLLFSSWGMTAKSDLNGTAGTIPAGYWSFYGMFRFQDYGRDFCISYIERTPHRIYLEDNTVSSADLIVENEYWSKGTFRGLVINENGNINGNFIFSFPEKEA